MCFNGGIGSRGSGRLAMVLCRASVLSVVVIVVGCQFSELSLEGMVALWLLTLGR